MSDNALDRAWVRFSLAVIYRAKRDMADASEPRRASAREFLYGDDSYYDLYLDLLRVSLPGVEIGQIVPTFKRRESCQ